ncbi:MAG: phosphoribosylaminoimidazole carboxylase [Vampirovibrio sp.]|jgi:5-(carboxyamino)imidazole ribonucleotide synthase|nr:phosphoribosylaminoimidazole carboxylase [Vampirovibrio sp.]
MSYQPGSRLGILGSGQLGRMLALVAKRLGYSVVIYSPDSDTPAGQVADAEITADYLDLDTLKRFASMVDVVTIEFENIPVDALKALEAMVPVYPQPHVLEIAQNRLREKTFLSELGIPVVPFQAVRSKAELEAGVRKIGLPLVLKTTGFGYDGKGQVKITQAEEALSAYQALGEEVCILEQFINLEREISVIAARSDSGEFVAYRPVENRHCNHILDVTLAPADMSPVMEQTATNITRKIMDAFDMRGLLCVEFFITREGYLLVNEMAPRPHNSGHYTIEAAVCSQFEQQLRAVCGLPLGSARLLHPAAMANLLGDVWADGEPGWDACLELDAVYLHLYGKQDAKPGRKMGHITGLGNSVAEAEALVAKAKARLIGK